LGLKELRRKIESHSAILVVIGMGMLACHLQSKPPKQVST
jgi:hypothetical protein